MEQHIHIGQNISKIRELLGIKQETLAANLKISQQTVSKIEQTKQLNQHTINRIAAALEVPATAIAQYNDKLIIDYLKGCVGGHPMNVVPQYFELLKKMVVLFEQILQLEQKTVSEPA